MRSRTIQVTAIALLVFAALGIGAGALVDRYFSQRYQIEQLEHIRELTGTIRAQMESILAGDLLIINATAAYISVNPDLTGDDFRSFAAEIIGDSETLFNVAAAPDLVLRYVYPVEGNEAIIGVNYRDLPEQLPLVLKARDSGELVVAGPIQVLQGGVGFLGRAPVYYERDGERVFWGIVSSLISFDDMIGRITPFLEQHELRMSVRGIDGTGSSGRAFYGSDDLFRDDRSVLRDVEFPNGSWQIAVAPVAGWTAAHPYQGFVWTAVAVVVLLATAYVYRQTSTTQQIRANEQRLNDITQASQDIIWETDHAGSFTYVSGRGEALLGYSQAELIGTSIFDLIAATGDPEAPARLRAAMNAAAPILDMEVWLQAVTGTRVCVQRNAVPLFDRRSGAFTGYRGVDKNISVRKQLQAKVEANAAQLEMFFAQSLDGFFFMMLDEPVVWNDATDKEAVLDYVFEHQRITRTNDALLEQYRASASDFIGLTPHGFFEHDIPGGRALWRTLFDERRLHIDTDERRFDGTRMAVEGDYIVMTDAAGRITGHFGVQRDVTAEREAEHQLERYIAINDDHVIISQTDLDGIITYASTAFCTISGYAKDELIGQDHDIIRHPDMPDELFTDLWETIEAGRPWHGEIKNLKKDGGFYWVDTDITPLVDRHGERYGYMAVRQDITAQKELEVVSVTDRLTGLFNRQKIDRALEEERVRHARYDEQYSVIILDIDHFKSINDTFGHLEGDRVLTAVARIVERQIRSTDIPGRWGGEEFMVLCPHTDTAGAIACAEELRRSIEEHDFGLGRPVTASFGVAQAPNTTTEELLRSADAALYKAKEAGRNRVIAAGQDGEA